MYFVKAIKKTKPFNFIEKQLEYVIISYKRTNSNRIMENDAGCKAIANIHTRTHVYILSKLQSVLSYISAAKIFLLFYILNYVLKW